MAPASTLSAGHHRSRRYPGRWGWLWRRFALPAGAASLGLLVAACGQPSLWPAGASGTLPDIVDYDLHVRPILSDKCFACYGPDAEAREADLRLDLPDSAYHALKEGARISTCRPSACRSRGKGLGQPVYAKLWSNGFLDSIHQGVQFSADKDPVLNLNDPPGLDRTNRQQMLDRLAALNQRDYEHWGDPAIVSKIRLSEVTSHAT